MTVEPMTDAEVDRLRATANAKWIDRGGMWMRPIDVLDLIARLDAERTRADAAEAERDAAVARAMPEAQLIQTKEEAAQLPAGTYYVSPVEAGEGWFAVEALDTVSGPRWLYLDDGDPRGDHMIAGCFVIRLPDLPTPTAAQEG